MTELERGPSRISRIEEVIVNLRDMVLLVLCYVFIRDTWIGSIFDDKADGNSLAYVVIGGLIGLIFIASMPIEVKVNRSRGDLFYRRNIKYVVPTTFATILILEIVLICLM